MAAHSSVCLQEIFCSSPLFKASEHRAAMKISVADVERQLEMDEEVASAFATSPSTAPVAAKNNNSDSVKVITSIPPKESYGVSEFTPLRLVPLSANSAVGTYRTWEQVKSQVSTSPYFHFAKCTSPGPCFRAEAFT